MKPAALLLLALVGVAAAGCGSGGTKAGHDPITVTGTTTISNVATGTLVSCKRGVPGGPMKVPPTGHGVTANVDGTGPSSSGKLQLTHRQDGSVVAVCGGPSAESVSASAS